MLNFLKSFFGGGGRTTTRAGAVPARPPASKVQPLCSAKATAPPTSRETACAVTGAAPSDSSATKVARSDSAETTAVPT